MRTVNPQVLQAENARLVKLLEQHGIDWRLSNQPRVHVPVPEPSRFSTSEKVALFRRLFRGRVDVYPIRWESKTSRNSGYAPACANEWRAGVCEKPRIKCGDCSNRVLIPLSDSVIYNHLAGERTVGIYPLLADDTCYFLAVDFDKADWREDAQAFVNSCGELGVPASLEISRSGQGAHVWVFFACSVSARDARRLGTAIISHTYHARTNAIAAEVESAYSQGRKVLVLTERTEHLAAIQAALVGKVPAPFVLHGRMSKKQRASLITELNALSPNASRILLATAKLVGEGFDHPPLDTLVLAMPVSWKGTLQQYAGRLHREHVTKTDVRIIDFVDTGHPALRRMWDKRQLGYRTMGYQIVDGCQLDLGCAPV
jgi:Helicase conserved C-terminal domain